MHACVVALPALSCAISLFLQFQLKSGHVETHGLLICNFFCEVEREAEGVVELEDFNAGNRADAGLPQPGDNTLKSFKSDSDHCREALFLRLDDTHHVISCADQVRVSILHLIHDETRQFVEEWLLVSKQCSLADAAAHDLSENIPSAFIGWEHAITDQES